MRTSIIGGDHRSVKLGNLLQEDGHDVKLYGFDEVEDVLKISKTLELAIEESDIIIGPLPCSRDNIFLNTPLYSEKIELEEIFKKMKKDQLFIGGKISEELYPIAESYGIQLIDYLQREEMIVRNAIPTAEGAIQAAMEHRETTIHGSNIMILGFGRIGKVLSKMLQGLGANVYVMARKYESLAWITSYGYKEVYLKDIKEYLKTMDIIFNTIPFMILNEEMLLKIRKDCLIIDLASEPGGVDFEAAKELEIKAIWALGLPGKVAPQTAAEIIRDTIYNITSELEV